MKLIELIGSLKTIDQAEIFMIRTLPGVDLDQIDTYLKDSLDIHSEIAFFDAETIPGTSEIEVNGIKYANLLPFYMLQEMVEAYANPADEKLTDTEIAMRVIEYVINDA